MFRKYNGFVSKARVSACMYFLVNKEIKLAKESYYRNAFMQHSGNSGKTWQIVNDLTSRKSKRTSVRELNLNGNSTGYPKKTKTIEITYC